MTVRPSAPATERNRQPILEVLEIEFRDRRQVLEIGSGTGQHAVYFAAEMPHLHWQTADLLVNHEGIQSWIDWAGLPNAAGPIEVDMANCDESVGTYDAVFSANTAHIMSFPLVKKMIALVGQVLHQGGVFCLYGPFRQGGEFGSESNVRFDRSLRDQSVEMGIRDLEDIEDLASGAGLSGATLYAMPANNLLVVWRKA
jgi:cyclopropane fatty-acyl-phospholipid synthase-like methyltransferase